MSTWLPSFRNEIDSASETKTLPDEQPTPSVSEVGDASNDDCDDDIVSDHVHNMTATLSVDEQEVTPEQILGYAEWLEIPITQPELLWIAEYGLTAPLPDDWRTCLAKDNSEAPAGYTHVRDKMYFYNIKSGESSWEHPCDKYFRELARSFVVPDEVIKIPRRRKEPTEYKTTGTQAVPEYRTKNTQVENVVVDKCCSAAVETSTVGTAPMPVTMTTMTNINCDGGTNTTPGIENLIPPSVPGSKRASRVRLDPFSSPTMSAVPYPTLVSTGVTSAAGGGGGAGGGVKDGLPPKARDELKSRVITEFQEQLAAHKKEILDVIARETPIPPIPENETPLAPLPPPSFPSPPSAESSKTRSRTVTYLLILLAHLTICFIVVSVLPYVVDPSNYPFLDIYQHDDFDH